MPELSLIIPVLNEAARLRQSLQPLQWLRHKGHEIIVVDGGSTDASVSVARDYADRVITHSPGRAAQMNAGAAQASGRVLLFVHADTILPEAAAELIAAVAAPRGQFWGFFRVRLSGQKAVFRVIEFFMNQRSRLTSIATGDQVIFVDTELFQRVNGYDDMPLMEDIAICKKLKRINPPVYITTPVITSSRRWEAKGTIRTILLMWRLRLAYFFGTDPVRLARKYHE